MLIIERTTKDPLRNDIQCPSSIIHTTNNHKNKSRITRSIPHSTTLTPSPQIIILLLLAATLSALPAIPFPTNTPLPVNDASPLTPSLAKPASPAAAALFRTSPVAAPEEFKSFGTDE
jgi:hypothetical protein